MQPDQVFAFKAFWLIVKFFHGFNLVICTFMLQAVSVSLIYLSWCNAVTKGQQEFGTIIKKNYALSPIKGNFSLHLE